MMAKTSPTQRSLELCRRHGWTVGKVEHWNSFAKRRVDLFGVIDLVALTGSQIVGIQTTSGDNVSARVVKILASEPARAWLESGGRLIVHGWRKLARVGGWDCREVEVTLEDFRNGNV